MRHPLRKILQEFGIDVHRYRGEVEPLTYLQTLGVETILDIGANTGQFAREIRQLLPRAQIYSFEPIAECYQKLLEVMRGDMRFKAFNTALGDTEGTTTIHRSSYSPSSSLLPMQKLHKKLFPHTAGETIETVTIARLDTIASELALQEPLLIKLDVQGYEEHALRGAPETIRKASAILTEASFVELYEGQPLFPRIYELLTAEDFAYQGALHQKIDPETGQILFEDALFVRDNHTK